MNHYKKRKLKDKLFKILGLLSILISLGFLILLIYKIFKTGWSYLSFDFIFVNDITMAPSALEIGDVGIYTPLIGSLLTMLVVLLIAVPIGIIAGLYIEEYMDKKSKLYAITNMLTVNLAGVPSVIYGILGATIFMALNLRGTFIAAGVTLSLLILPVIIVTTIESLKTVPNSLKEAAYGLGMTKFQVIKCVTIPYAISPISTGVILSLSRAIGEAAPLIMVGVAVEVTGTPTSLTSKISALPLVIDSFYSSAGSELGLAAATAIVLLVILLIMNSIAIIIRHKTRIK